MKDSFFIYIKKIFDEITSIYLDDIRGNNPNVFIRNRKISLKHLILQMFANKGRTQLSELMDFYKDIDKELDVSTVAFYNARMKFNPYALKVMLKDFMSDIYDKEDKSFVKLNGYYITAIDGSSFYLPSTEENAAKYGRATIGDNTDENNCPVMGRLSLLYDCVNKCIFDVEVGEYMHSEVDFASKHLKNLKEMIKKPTITIFDRGYFSIKLLDQMVDNNQKFLFRLSKTALKKYVNLVNDGEDKTFEVIFNTVQTNRYKNDNSFRQKIMNTKYNLRIAKVPIVDPTTQKITYEILLTNLAEDEFDIEALKELYHLRWNIETAYNILKNKMKLEEFSGYRETLILQDIFTSIWIYNITMIRIIELNEKNEIPRDRYKYEMRRNINISIGIIKTYFIKSLLLTGTKESTEYFNTYTELINKYLVPIRQNRHNKRGNTKNKSRMSYRYSY